MNKLELQADVEKRFLAYQALCSEYNTNKETAQSLSKRLAILEERQRDLSSSWSRTGKISQARCSLERARLVLRDFDARRVEWVEPSRNLYCPDEVYVVVKVTAKRVYIRNVGSSRPVYRDKVTGKGTSKYDGAIDIQATFPEGVDNFKESV